MKYLVISDIHGSAESLEKALDCFGKQADYLLLCGDYLNHGPRNPLPEGWNPKKVASVLNENKGRIICVRGNCDAEVDEMVLEFPCLAAYTTVFDSNRRVFVHHGHLYNREKLENWLPKGTLIVSAAGLVYGKRKVGKTTLINKVLEESSDFYYFNPGSISLPKCDDGKTCGLIDISSDGKIKAGLYTIEGKFLRSLDF